jgi:hypothetical protein
VEEVEQARVPELEPPPFAVEGREGKEKIGERSVLAAEQIGEAVREVARFHERIFSRDFRGPQDARSGPLAHEREVTVSTGFDGRMRALAGC